MVPSERARLRRPGSDEGEARRGDRNSCWLASGRKPGAVGMNRDGEGPALGQGTARLGLAGKRPAASRGKYLQEPVGHGREEEGQPWVALEAAASAQVPSPVPSPLVPGGAGAGVPGRRALVEAEKQSDHIHAIRSGWLGGASVTHPSLHAPSDPTHPSASQQTSSTTSLGIKVTLSPLPTSRQPFALKQKCPTPCQALNEGQGPWAPAGHFVLRAQSLLTGRLSSGSPLLPRARLRESRYCFLVLDTRLKPLAERRGRRPGWGSPGRGSWGTQA